MYSWLRNGIFILHQIHGVSFRASMINNTTSTTEYLRLIPGLKYRPIVHTRAKELHSYTYKKNQCKLSHMFLNVPDGVLCSLLDEVIGVVSRHATFYERSLVQRWHGHNLVQLVPVTCGSHT